MSFARKCDRCGKFYEIESKDAGTVINIYSDYGLYGEIDVCEDCFESFKRWRLGAMKNVDMDPDED